MPSAEPLLYQAQSRKPGRPIGSKAQVVRDARSLGIHHFAFVRASLLGIDLRQAFTRYLAWPLQKTSASRFIARLAAA